MFISINTRRCTRHNIHGDRTARGSNVRLCFPPRQLQHYLKRSLVFMWRAGDVASCSTVPSRAVYIRRPIWRYKTRQRKGGGPEPRERRRGSHFTERQARAPLFFAPRFASKDMAEWKWRFRCFVSWRDQFWLNILTVSGTFVALWVVWDGSPALSGRGMEDNEEEAAADWAFKTLKPLMKNC